MARFSLWNRHTFIITAVTSLFSSGCLERDLGLQGPRTTSLISEQIRQAPPTKLDLLLVVDNSASMADKQAVMAAAIPDLIRNLAVPPCITPQGASVARQSDESCPGGSAPEFEALSDMQVGVITTSLGSAGGEAEGNCDNEESQDMAHLLPTRPRAQQVTSDLGVLSWKKGQDTGDLIDRVRSLITLAGESGCGGESSLEAWYRFLVDPAPYTKLVLSPCQHNPNDRSCAARELDAEGKPAVDTALLAQRAKFLRPDSLVAIVMLTDENDCSLREHPRAWVLGEATNMWRGSTACEVDPNSECCLPCGTLNPPTQCLEAESTTLPGCAENDGVYSDTSLDDQPNLRCYDQKRRFGIDFLQPTARYVHALRSTELCFARADNAPTGCKPSERSKNPLFAQSGTFARTSPDSVILVGILGVPWQDVAVSADPSQRLTYLSAVATAGGAGINWPWLLPSAEQDPLLKESIEPRQGINPATGIALAPPSSPRYANPINGHEHANLDRDELQFACIFPLPEGERMCDSANGFACDCDSSSSDEDGNPLCQAPDNSFGATQYFAKAYPATRALEVLNGVGDSAVVASICAKEMTNDKAPDYGYRPAMQAIVDKVKTKLSELCFDRELTTDEQGETNCKVIELQATQETCSCSGTRVAPKANVLQSVRKQMRQLDLCTTDAECAALCACEIGQVAQGPGATLNSCQTDAISGENGWCYVDATWGDASAQLVSNCRGNARRKVRFVGDGVPRESSVTFLACQGSGYDAESP